MSFPSLSRRWLIVAAVAAVLAASFAAGLTFGPRELVPALAQTAPEETPVSQDPATQPAIELDPMLPLSEVGEVRINKIIQQTGPDPRTTAAGRSADGGPPPGNYFYLPGLNRYYSLPDDVKLIDIIGLGTCILPRSECPTMPLYFFQRGAAKVALDSMGVMWDAGEGTDFSAFPFFSD